MSGRIDDYVIENILGSGGYGDVYLVHHQDNVEQRVVIKVIRDAHSNQKHMDKFKGEVQALGLLKHSHIVKMVNSREDSKWVNADGDERRVAIIVLEYVKAKDLFDYVILGPFSEPICRYYFK